MEQWRLGRRPGLDGLRGVAILLVLACHLPSIETGHYDRFHAIGCAGVEVFFALSGFLITAQLLEEREDSGRVRFGRFYARRARRLLPALVVVVGFLLAAQAVLHETLMPDSWPLLLFVANWLAALGVNMGAMPPMWSLAIEEQFYLLWPLALLLVSSRWRRGPLIVAVAGCCVSAVLRFTLAGGDRVYYGSDTQAGPLLAGAVLACLAHAGLRQLRVSPLVPASLVGVCALLPLTDAPWVGDRLVPTVVPLLTVVAIWAVCSSPGGPLAWGWLRWCGRRSYALYLWHIPLLWLVWLTSARSLAGGVVAIALAFGVAELSWRFVEEPFLRRRVSRTGPAEQLASPSVVVG